MGMKFRKSIKIAPGVKVNLGKKSVGMSIGGKYGGMSINSKTGAKARVSAPGTGLSYTTKIGSASHASNSKTQNTDTAPTVGTRTKNKWISLLLCLFTVCGHKFYEGKIGMGLIYIFTAGLFGIGWIIDIFVLLAKPNPYYV